MAALTVSQDEVKRLKGLGFLNNKGTDNFSARVITVNGRVTSEKMRCLAEAADKFGNGHVLFTTRLTAEVPGIPYEKTEEFCRFIAGAGMETGGTGPRVRPVVSCKGTTCQYGQLDSYAISQEVHERFYVGYHHVVLPHKFKIAVGGCPNNCVKPNLNDVGIMGWRKGYKIFLGGRWGRDHAIGKPMSKIFTDKEEMLNTVEKAILLFKDQGQPGERFSATIERLGFEQVEAQLLSDDLLNRKEEILAK